MKILLSEQCENLTGSLGKGFGYFVVRRNNAYYSVRSKHQPIPQDGHLAFILACAKLARTGLYVTDVIVQAKELQSALYEAGKYLAAQNLRLPVYHARDILNLKTLFGL